MWRGEAGSRKQLRGLWRVHTCMTHVVCAFGARGYTGRRHCSAPSIRDDSPISWDTRPWDELTPWQTARRTCCSTCFALSSTHVADEVHSTHVPHTTTSRALPCSRPQTQEAAINPTPTTTTLEPQLWPSRPSGPTLRCMSGLASLSFSRMSCRGGRSGVASSTSPSTRVSAAWKACVRAYASCSCWNATLSCSAYR